MKFTIPPLDKKQIGVVELALDKLMFEVLSEDRPSEKRQKDIKDIIQIFEDAESKGHLFYIAYEIRNDTENDTEYADIDSLMIFSDKTLAIEWATEKAKNINWIYLEIKPIMMDNPKEDYKAIRLEFNHGKLVNNKE